MNDGWKIFQDEIARCTLCRTELPHISVDCPRGTVYPETLERPSPIRVLFVGVAPPEKGRHFYADPKDRLKAGLFAVLDKLGVSCRDVDEFVGHGFFLVHTAKCAIQGTTKPSRAVSRYCASQFLHREIEQLRPRAVCFLSKNVGYPVCLDLYQRWSGGEPPPFGKVTAVTVGDMQVHLLATNWPGRGWQAETETHLRPLLEVVQKI
jgi:hypothetical protein